MGRSPRASLAFFAALGLSGCLLFTDPINKAPTVTINEPSDPVIVGKPAKFTATVTDDRDNPASLSLEWAEFKSNSLDCKQITPAIWALPHKSISQDSLDPYEFIAGGVDKVCLCAQATDHNGATGQECVSIVPVNPVPIAKIKDLTTGNPSGPPKRLLCSQMHLSAEDSTFTTGDQFNWSIEYTGSDASAKQPQFTDCAGVYADKPDLHRCFYAGSPGTYVVTLKIKDSSSTTSDPARFEIPVDVDTPACLQRTDPEVYARRILLSRSTDLAGTYLNRTFSVLGVKDDCQPYPPPASPALQFVWSILDTTQPSPTWTYQAGNSDTFTLSQSMFPYARPGDTIKLRVEVRDASVQELYKYGGQTLPLDMDICCGSYPCGLCSATNDCVRWTTWTVQFQP